MGYVKRPYVDPMGRQISPMEVDHLQLPMPQFATGHNHVGHYDPNRLYAVGDINRMESATRGQA